MGGREHGDGKGHHHDRRVALGNATQIAQTVDVRRADSDADHHSHKRGHRNLTKPGAGQKNHGQEAHTGKQGRQSGSAAVVHIHHRLPHKGAAGHTAEQRRHDVGHALTTGLNVLVGG